MKKLSTILMTLVMVTFIFGSAYGQAKPAVKIVDLKVWIEDNYFEMEGTVKNVSVWNKIPNLWFVVSVFDSTDTQVHYVTAPVLSHWMNLYKGDLGKYGCGFDMKASYKYFTVLFTYGKGGTVCPSIPVKCNFKPTEKE